jgi:uncharacterized protein with HEPN domain
MKDKAVYIAAAIESIDLIKSYISGYEAEDFLHDRKTQDAVIRNLEIIGQALKDFGIENLRQQNPDIPWIQIAGMRNVLAHEYLGVDMALIWETLIVHLDSLKQGLEEINSTNQ